LDGAERGNAVRRIAREGDPDRSLAVLFAPSAVRDDLYALIAFNVELACIAEQVSEPDLGIIRLHWWREAIAGGASGHPVADAFSEALRRHELSPSRIEALVEARRFDVVEKIMPDWPALETYLSNTAGNLFALTSVIMSGRSDEPLCEAAGRAYGLTGLMRALPIHAAKGRMYLPADMLHRYGTSPQRILAGVTDDGLEHVLTELHGKAREALDDSRRLLADQDAKTRAAFRPLALVEPYLSKLASRRHNPLHDIAEINPLSRLWRLARWE
jgi:15-cis-phytoene synthase